MGGLGETRCVLCGALVPTGSDQCPRCGTKTADIVSANATVEAVARTSSRDMLKGDIPRTALPDIKNSCPLCAHEIDSTMAKCPRCGVPLKGAQAPAEPPVEKPSVPSPQVTAPTPSLVSAENAAPVPDKITPAPDVTPAPPITPGPPVRTPELVSVTSVEAKRVAPGLVNGRGAVNGTGLVNGRGAINGTGLINGTGMVNGTGSAGRQTRSSSTGTTFLKRWQFLAILVAIAVILPTFFFLSYSRPSALSVDGDFGEWAHVAKFGMQAPASLPEVTVEEWAIQTDAEMLYLYLKTGSSIMGTSNVDSFFLFIDSDGSPTTGYSVSGLGANYLLELHGWDEKVESASLMRFDSSYDHLNWTSWTDIGSVAVVITSDKLEAVADMPMALESDARFLLLAQDNPPDRSLSISYPVPAEGGVLIITQEPGTSVNPLTGVVPVSSNISLARLILRCEGASGIVSGIAPVIDRAGVASPISEISLSPGETKTVDVFAVTSATSPQSLVSASVTVDGVTSTFSTVVIVGEPVRAYVSLPPPSIQIDGAFGDWSGRVLLDSNGELIANPNIDIAGAASVNTTSYSAFYVGVQGEIFQGAYVPATRGKPSSQGGGGPVIPQRKTGEDLLRVYIDSDISNATGELITRSPKVIGADYLLELNGMDGKVVSKTLFRYISGAWVTVSVNVAAIADEQRIEMSVPASAIGGSSSLVAIIETTDWRGRSDWEWTGGIPDPWTIDSSGNTYMSNDGATWIYLGTPTLAPGDRIVDIAVSIGAQGGDIFLVTNTGRTFYWIPGTSTNWTVGETNPIDTATYSEAVSMSFYQNAGAWLLTKNGSYFWLMDAHKSTKDWTYQDIVGGGISDLIDLEYLGGTMYALRSSPNTGLNYSNNGNTFVSVTNPTGSTSNQTQFTYIDNGPGPTDDVLYVLCQNGNIRYSADGGSTWSAKGNLPTPTGANTTRYVSLGIDPAGYMWVVTDTGYTFRSTDTTTYNSFTCTGRSPITSVVAILPTTAIPEFPMVMLPIIALFFVIAIPKIRRRCSGSV